MINVGSKEGRLDAFVQSSDKNFMVPVGGAIISSCSPDVLTPISQTYPGRATSSPVIDLFITLLSMGQSGYSQLLEDRKKVYEYFKSQLKILASSFGEHIVETPGNQISIAMTLDSFSSSSNSSNISSTDQGTVSDAQIADNGPSPSTKPDLNQTFIGAMLFNHCTSGIRVVSKGKSQKINGWQFSGYGSHHNEYPSVYLTVAASVGMTCKDVDLTIKRLQKVLKQAHKKLSSK